MTPEKFILDLWHKRRHITRIAVVMDLLPGYDKGMDDPAGLQIGYSGMQPQDLERLAKSLDTEVDALLNPQEPPF